MISISLPHGSPKHDKICQALRQRLRACEKGQSNRKKKWREAENLMVGYIPTKEADRLRKSKREDGDPQYTTIMMPYTYAVVMSAYSYFATVFLSRSPVLQFMGATAEGEDQVLAMEALHSYQMVQGRMLPNLYIWCQDVARYGEAWVSPYWKQVKHRTSEILMVEDKFLGIVPTGRMKKVRQVTEIIGYQGNALFNIQPSCVFTDPRFPRTRFQEGEFVAVEITMSINDLKEGEGEGRYINVGKLKRNGILDVDPGETYNDDAESIELERPDIDAFSSDVSKEANDIIKGYEFIINLVPKDWDLGSSAFQEKWVFTISKDMRTIVEARPQGCLHNKFPLALLELEAEGYAQYSRSLAEIFTPVQQSLDWLVNSHMFNVRQSLNNNWLLDPSKIETRDLTAPDNPAGLAIRLKAAAYGTDVRTALMQLPVQDVTKSHYQDIQFMYDLGERLGINDPVQGITSPSSRRTAQEVRGDQTFSTSRLKVMSEYFSCTGWSDMAAILTQNSQQYYDANMKLKIVGDAAKLAGDPFINVTPEAIVGQYSFVPVDGTMPVDRFAQANLWRETIAQMAQVPQVFSEYDLGKIFGYVAQLGGIKNLDRFRIQIGSDADLIAQEQRGNVVPITPGPGNIMEPGQIPGMGATA